MRGCALVSVFGMLFSAGIARTPGFDPEDVVRQLRAVHSDRSPVRIWPPPDSGEFLVDTEPNQGQSPHFRSRSRPPRALWVRALLLFRLGLARPAWGNRDSGAVEKGHFRAPSAKRTE